MYLIPRLDKRNSYSCGKIIRHFDGKSISFSRKALQQKSHNMYKIVIQIHADKKSRIPGNAAFEYGTELKARPVR